MECDADRAREAALTPDSGIIAVGAIEDEPVTGMKRIAVCLMLPLISAPVCAQEAPDAEDAASLMQRAYEVSGGNDSFSRIRFHFEFDRGRSSSATLVMAFRRGSGDVDYRVIMFSESPPDHKDTGFLGVFYRPGAGKEDEMWLYLPELRSTRRLTHSQPSHAHDHGHDMTGHMRHGESPDEFSVSELDHEELMPRWPGLDDHRLIALEDYEGRLAWKIESTPRDPATSVYGRRVHWVDREHALLLRIEYHEPGGRHVKTQTQQWRSHGGDWLWERVVAINHLNGNRTVLEQSDVRVNAGLPDELFSRRVLSRGAGSFAGRVERLGR